MDGVISRPAVPGIADLPAYQPGRDVDEVRQELGLERVFKPASNENPLGPSPRIRDFLAAALAALRERAAMVKLLGFYPAAVA